MQHLITAANDLSIVIDTFIDEAAKARSDALTWLANNERITEQVQVEIHQLRILLQTVNNADWKLKQAYSQVEDLPAFKTTA